MAIASQQSPSFQYGQSSILVQNDDFEDGYDNGLLHHPNEELHPLTDTAFFAWIVKNILDVRTSNAWNTGYLLGSIRRLLIGARDLTEPEAPQIQFGSVTLRLNNWRFREGFCTGQEDSLSSVDERSSQRVVTAHDLLRSIAHRDPETKRYFFAEDEINTVEDTLGQFTASLCTALFPRQESMIESGQQNGVVYEA